MVEQQTNDVMFIFWQIKRNAKVLLKLERPTKYFKVDIEWPLDGDLKIEDKFFNLMMKVNNFVRKVLK